MNNKQEDEIFCPECGKPIKKNAVICVHCGVQVKELASQSKEAPTVTHKNRTAAVVLSVVGIMVNVNASPPFQRSYYYPLPLTQGQIRIFAGGPMKKTSSLLIILIVFLTACTGNSPTPHVTATPIATEEVNRSYERIGLRSADSTLDPQSIIFDGEFVWMTNEGTRPPFDFLIFKVDPETGEIIRKWEASSPCENGSTFDGQYFWTVGNVSPSGMNPPWEDQDFFDLIYKYSISDGNLVLLEKYALDSHHVGVGDVLTSDSSGNIWVIIARPEITDSTLLSRLEFFPGEEAEGIPNLPDVWTAKIAETVSLPISAQLHIKGAAWIDDPNIGNYLVVSGYPLDGYVDADFFTLVFDVSKEFSVEWEYYSNIGNDAFGPFGLYWDPENRILWSAVGWEIYPLSFGDFIDLIESQSVLP